MRAAIKKILNLFLIPLARLYLSRERTYHYHDVIIKIKPGVFHPGLFYSTKVLLKYLENMKLKNKKLLELGAGTGLISIVSAKRGALVTATDISKIAIENIEINAKLNGQKIKVIESDLFDSISDNEFDLIVINPPYYKKEPKTDRDRAWFCGENYDFFKKLFKQLRSNVNNRPLVLMILSEDCDIKEIQKFSSHESLSMDLIQTVKKWGEKNFLFSVK